MVYHKALKYKGVIIGWDEKENAPEKWLNAVRGSKKERGESQPNYAVLIDTRNRLTVQMGYVIQSNLKLSEGKVFHPMTEKYFEGMETSKKYRMRPFIKNVYPND